MANETNEPRALTAALAAPPFVTKGAGFAMHVANRHVERWAPEAGANRVRSLRNLGFVDRLVAPWIESAQRSASQRMFGQYISNTAGERATTPVSWVFPRPWYQDELDWMAAARQVGTQSAVAQAQPPNLLTTRGTYVAPAALALPSALYEFVAPSLSVARPDAPAVTGDGSQVWSPLVSAQAAQAAHVMSRAVAPLVPFAGPDRAVARMSPGLRAVLSTILERTARTEAAPTRLASAAPELVTPPAPRASDLSASPSASVADARPQSDATQLAERSAEQRVQIAELQRVTRVAAEREATRAPDRADRIEEVQQRAAAVAVQRNEAAARQVQDDRIARGVATQRLHEQARDAAVRDAQQAVAERAIPAISEAAPQPRALDSAVASAIAALPPELAAIVAAGISRRPDRAVQTISEISDALRTVELLARSSAAGGSFESTRGPRIMMPAGLGGLVATVDRAPMVQLDRPRTDRPAERAQRTEQRVPTMSWVTSPRGATTSNPTPTSALGATTTARPAALQHVAWADRWLARFAGARPQSLDVLSVSAGHSQSAETRLAASAPGAVFVAPDAERAVATKVPETRAIVDQPVFRFDDNAETPDDMFVAISAAAARARTPVAAAPVAKPTQPELVSALATRDTLADLVAHAAPVAPGAGLSAQLASSPFAPALRHVMPLGAAPSFDVRALFGTEVGMTYLAGLLAPSTHEIAIAGRTAVLPEGIAATIAPTSATTFATTSEPDRERAVADWEATYVAPEAPPIATDDVVAPQAIEPLTTLRSALLSWDVDTFAAQDGSLQTRAGQPTIGAGSPSAARSMVEAMSLPMLGSSMEPQSYAAPGMIGDRAEMWSVAQERSSADLAFDFVTPELILAARVYGLGPAEAAQAARLAIAGPGQLGAMATTVDRTFVQAMTIDADRKERVAAITAYPPAAGSAITAATVAGAAPTSQHAFGVDRRVPRGAFLWPSSTISALGLNAPGPDGAQSMSIAALELLAAQAVAELGTYAAFATPNAGGASSTPTTLTTAPSTPSSMLATPSAEAQPTEVEVLGTAATLLPSARRTKFEAMYVALGRSSMGRSWSPVARAARALALAGRGDETITARERATIAWEMVPLVGADEATSSTGEVAQTAYQRHSEMSMLEGFAAPGRLSLAEPRAGLAALSARAGEAIGSFVMPSVAPSSSSSSSSSREQGAVLRAPTAAQELVRTGRPAGRHGGGEVDIPPWFEAAARKMFADRSGTSASEGMSLAEMTLVTAAPASHIAASTRGSSSSGASAEPAASSKAGRQDSGGQQIDVEKVANDVYKQILVLMDAARSRNGEPYL